MTTSAISTLMPCPFCGGMDIREDLNLRNKHSEVFCDECGATVSEDGEASRARALWNRRSSPSMDRKRFENAPCYLCGYSGPGYFQPSTHPCASRYHAADTSPSGQASGDEALRDALAFYADKKNWLMPSFKPAPATLPAGTMTRDLSPLETDNGARARAALSRNDGKEGRDG